MGRRDRGCPALVLLLARTGLDEAGVSGTAQTETDVGVWECGSVAGLMASGPDRVVRNEMVDARARVLCSPSLRGRPRLRQDDDC